MSELVPEAPLEGTPSEPEVAVEPAAQEAPAAERQRDPETGRFVASDPRAQRLLEKYGGDLDQALGAAIDAQDLIGRQAQELGELRRIREEQQAQQYRVSPDQISAYAEQDPQQAVVMAYQQYGRGSVPYEQALRAWGDIDPFTAARFDGQAAVADYDNRNKDRYAQVELSNSLQQVASRYPDFSEYGDAILREAQNSPVVAALKEQGRPASAEVIETLYLAAKGREALANQTARGYDAAAARAEKLGSGVASATAARPSDAPPMSEEDAFKAEYLEMARSMGFSTLAD